MPYTKLCSSKGLSGQITTFGFFFWPDNKKSKGCGLFHVVQTFHKLYQLKVYMGSWVYLPRVFFWLQKYNYCHILGYTEKVRDLAKWDPHQVNP